MIIYNRLIICILFLLSCNAVYALPSIDEVIKKLSIGKNVKWEFDVERTSAHLGLNSDKNCIQSFVFVSQKEVDIFVSCNDGKNQNITKTTQIWTVQLDDKKHNNIIKIGDEIYDISFSDDGNFMKLSTNPKIRPEALRDIIYKRLQ